MRCSVWREAAENVAESLHRGTRVIVTGRLKSRSYETKEGEKRTVVELEVDEIGPSLRYATAKVNKTQRGGGGGGFGGRAAVAGRPTTRGHRWLRAARQQGGQGGRRWPAGRPAAASAARRVAQRVVVAARPSATTSPPSDPTDIRGRVLRGTEPLHQNEPSLGDQGSSAGTSQQKESTTMAKPAVRKPKKKANPLKAAKVENIDYKDTALLRKFISDRGKIRARRVTGVTVQEQRLIATAVKNAREMALLPYSSSSR